MLSLNKQLLAKKLVCPRTRVQLQRKIDYLETIDGQYKYPLLGEVPILFSDVAKQQEYLKENSGKMNYEYTVTNKRSLTSLLHKYLSKDFKNRRAINAFNLIFDNLYEDSLCLAIGGGPRRHHENLVNLNIGAFENVDIVADAYCLPYDDNSVDAVYIEAVLEHLEFPEVAIKEIFRVLKLGGKVYADTPFMQDFHGYPNHFQNFTVEGHTRLFSRNGFQIKEFGTSVGPTFALSSFLVHYIRSYSPNALIRYPLLLAAYILSILLKPIDLIINKNSNSQLLASSTYVCAVK